MSAGAWLIGLHLLSAHAAPGYQSATVGIYAQSPEGWTAGVLRNSEGRLSAYAGHTSEWGPVSLTVGGIGGYKRGGLQPLLVPSVRVIEVGDLAARLSLIPPPGQGGSAALHLSVEMKW
jgi:hypothetical protein